MLDVNVKVSIITPAFNDGRFIADTIKSVLAQTYQNLELVIVDDHSTDNTIDVIKSFKDERIKLICNEENCGAAYSRNVALRNATGDYIAFLDGDDIWKEDKIEKQLSFMVENNYDFSCCFYNLINENGEKIGIYYKAPKRITHRKFMKSNYIGCLTAMYKRDIYSDLQIPDSILKRNDYAMWLKLSEKADCFALPEVLASYRKRNSSISSGRKRKLIKYHKKMFSALYSCSNFLSSFYAYRNIVFYGIRRIFYKKREQNNGN